MKIDTNIPIPTAIRQLKPRPSKYPFDKLEIGESFFVADRTAGAFGGTITHGAKKLPGRAFTSRTVVENGVQGCRVWRTA